MCVCVCVREKDRERERERERERPRVQNKNMCGIVLDSRVSLLSSRLLNDGMFDSASAVLPHLSSMFLSHSEELDTVCHRERLH